ncbi:MAG: hypothetical protein NZM43_03375 [Saprospiraceae bacterium]|nr:hypothetical protein [Saprospiraceae bacterium]MDW8483345.1 hypothetical protein [Saprospiraceae bacterium]
MLAVYGYCAQTHSSAAVSVEQQAYPKPVSEYPTAAAEDLCRSATIGGVATKPLVKNNNKKMGTPLGYVVEPPLFLHYLRSTTKSIVPASEIRYLKQW